MPDSFEMKEIVNIPEKIEICIAGSCMVAGYKRFEGEDHKFSFKPEPVGFDDDLGPLPYENFKDRFRKILIELDKNDDAVNLLSNENDYIEVNIKVNNMLKENLEDLLYILKILRNKHIPLTERAKKNMTV